MAGRAEAETAGLTHCWFGESGGESVGGAAVERAVAAVVAAALQVR